METDELANIFKALSDETRLKIVLMLKNGELCACKILESFQITQPTLSHHMKILLASEMIVARKEGVWTHYALNAPKIKEVQKIVKNLTSEG